MAHNSTVSSPSADTTSLSDVLRTLFHSEWDVVSTARRTDEETVLSIEASSLITDCTAHPMIAPIYTRCRHDGAYSSDIGYSSSPSET
ncbi:hypothetical protein J6590_034281 [Homalodisca vitripennis]|nr:hypothetical protein J6590_034281 [Homalodisca vitripennis]